MKCLIKISSIGLALVMMLSTVAQAQEERQGRDGAGRERGQQGQGQGQGRQRGGDQGGRGQRGGGFPGGRGRPGGGGIDKLTLASAKPIQEELKLGEDELYFVKQLAEVLRADSSELFKGIDFRSLPEDERRTKFEELGKKRSSLVKEAEKDLAEFLSEAQSKRLDEIALQIMGLRALANEEVAKKLKMTSEQKKGVEDARKSADDDRRKMFEEMRAGGGFEGIREKMEAARKKSDEKLLAVLSDDQKKQFADMKGKPFDVDPRSLFGGGRGGQRGGQPGGQPGGGRGGDRGQGGARGGDRGGRPEGDGGGRPQRPAAE